MTTKIKTQSNDLIIIENPGPFTKRALILFGYKDKDYKILGKLSELTDEDLVEFIELVGNDFNNKGEHLRCVFKNYNNNNLSFRSTKESFISLLQSEDIDTSEEDKLLIIKML